MFRISARVVFQVLVVFLVIGCGVALWGNHEYTKPGPLTAPATVIIPKGAGLETIGQKIAQAGVIRSAQVFTLIMRVTRLAHDLRAGEYAFTPGMAMRDATEMMLNGVTVKRRLTIAEGLTTRQVLSLVEVTKGLEGEIPDSVPEGSLLPETYFYEYGDKRSVLIERMRVAMREAVDTLWKERAPKLLIKSKEQAVVLASIVEKETALPAERPQVSGVFHNRLRRRMRLQSDPTVVYSVTNGSGPLDRPLTHADLAIESPYNTYRVRGLPPGPIANPGRAAIAAVLRPAKTRDLYFVADGTGGHAFARTLREHNRNVARWRKISRQKRRQQRREQQRVVTPD